MVSTLLVTVNPESAAITENTIHSISPDQEDGVSQVRQLLQQGEEQLQQGQIDRAIQVYHQIIALNPNIAIAYQYLGDAWTKSGRWQEAISAYCQAIQLNPNFFWSYNNLGYAYNALGQWEDAVTVYQKAIELDASFSWTYHNFGEALRALSRWQEAKRCYQQATELNPEFSWSYHHLGDVCVALQEWKEAVVAYRQAIELNPIFESYYSLGKSLAEIGELDEAILCYQKAISLDPNNQWIYLSLGEALQERSRHDSQEILASFRQAIQLNPDNFSAYHNLLEIEPKDETLWLRLGKAFAKQTQWSDAISCYHKALELRPDFAECYQQLGTAFTARSEDKEAIQAYCRASELYLERDLKEAFNCYQKALTLQPAQFAKFLKLSKHLVEKGLLEQVMAGYQQVFQHKFEQAEAHYEFALFLAKSDLLAEAIICFKKAPDTSPQLNQALEKIALPKPQTQGERYEYLWQCLNQLIPFDEAYAEGKIDVDLQAARAYFRQQISQTQTILYPATLTPQDHCYFEQFGLSTAYLNLIKRRYVALEEIYIHCFEETVPNPAKRTPLKESEIWHHQARMVDLGYIYSVCPATGQIVRANQSFYIQDRGLYAAGIYRFVGKETFYLIFRGLDAFYVYGIYLPRLDLIIHFYQDGESIDLIEVLSELKALAVSEPAAFKAYVSNSQRKEVANVIGWHNNLGHHLWNELTTIQYFYDRGKLPSIQKFITGNRDFFDVGSIYPEIPADKIIKAKDNHSLFKAILEQNLFGLRLCGWWPVSERFAQRLMQNSRVKCSQQFLSEVAQAKQHFPLLWLNLRGHNKIWLSQVEGYAKIVNQLHQDYPNLAVVFDGYASEKAIMEQIIARLNPAIKSYNALNCSLYETIVWVQAIDTYIVVIGSGLTLVSWIANKPGIAHGNRLHAASQTPDWWAHKRENAIPPIIISPELIKDELPCHFYCNYEIDWQVMYAEIATILKTI